MSSDGDWTSSTFPYHKFYREIMLLFADELHADFTDKILEKYNRYAASEPNQA